MSRYIIYITLIFSFFNALAQTSLSKVRADYAQILHLISGNVSASKLDEIIKNFQSLGDEEIAHRIISESLLFFNKSQTRAYNMDKSPVILSHADSMFLKELSPITQDLTQLPYFIYFSSIFSKSYNNRYSFLGEYFKLNEYQNDSFPNFPMESDNVDFFKQNMIILNWAIQFPQEIKFFDYVYRSSCKEIKGKICSEEDLINYYEMIYVHFNDSSFYKAWLPLTYKEYESKVTFSTSIVSKKEMFQDLDKFLDDAYLSILDRTPTSSELDSLKNYIEKNKDEMSPELIYLALILKKHE